MSSKRAANLADHIGRMDRQELMTSLRGMRCGFVLDFTEEYLNGISLEHLRHIVLAASLHRRDEPAVGA